jgi:hypothetical protein
MATGGRLPKSLAVSKCDSEIGESHVRGAANNPPRCSPMDA